MLAPFIPVTYAGAALVSNPTGTHLHGPNLHNEAFQGPNHKGCPILMKFEFLRRFVSSTAHGLSAHQRVQIDCAPKRQPKHQAAPTRGAPKRTSQSVKRGTCGAQHRCIQCNVLLDCNGHRYECRISAPTRLSPLPPPSPPSPHLPPPTHPGKLPSAHLSLPKCPQCLRANLRPATNRTLPIANLGLRTIRARAVGAECSAARLRVLPGHILRGHREQSRTLTFPGYPRFPGIG